MLELPPSVNTHTAGPRSDGSARASPSINTHAVGPRSSIVSVKFCEAQMSPGTFADYDVTLPPQRHDFFREANNDLYVMLKIFGGYTEDQINQWRGRWEA